MKVMHNNIKKQNNMKKILLLAISILIGVSIKAQNPPITPAWAFEHIAWEDSINTTEGR